MRNTIRFCAQLAWKLTCFAIVSVAALAFIAPLASHDPPWSIRFSGVMVLILSMAVEIVITILFMREISPIMRDYFSTSVLLSIGFVGLSSLISCNAFASEIGCYISIMAGGILAISVSIVIEILAK